MSSLAHPTIRLLALHVAPVDERWFAESAVPDSAWCTVIQRASLDAAIDALTTADSQPIDAVVVDEYVRDSTQWEAVERIRSACPRIPIVAIASERTPDALDRAIGSGADDALYRDDVTGALLARAVRYALAKRRADLAEQRAEAAIAVAQVREQFMAVLAHDLRSPLSSIVISTSLILKGTGIDEPRAKAATRIVRSADRMNRMIVDLLDVTRIRMGEAFVLKRERVSLTELCQEAVGEIQPSFATRALSFVAKGPAWGQWDAGHMTRLVSNLMIICLSASPTDTLVRIEIHEEANETALVVSHQGGRIPEEVLANIFEPFAAMTGSEKRVPVPGLGLGLYVAHQIALAHQGTLSVRSTENEGTTFMARFPISNDV